jgi:hypothetical protein
MEHSHTVIFDPARHGTVQVIELHQSGVTFLCPHCRSPFIVALTHEEAHRHKIHPGVYCSLDRKHFTMMLELRSGFWEEFYKEWDATNRSTIIVRGDESLDLSAYKVYINRNVHGTGARFADLAPPNSVYSRLPAGVYSVVVREHDPRKPDRIESNTIEIRIRDDEQITIRVSLREGRILLALDHAAKP